MAHQSNKKLAQNIEARKILKKGKKEKKLTASNFVATISAVVSSVATLSNGDAGLVAFALELARLARFGSCNTTTLTSFMKQAKRNIKWIKMNHHLVIIESLSLKTERFRCFQIVKIHWRSSMHNCTSSKVTWIHSSFLICHRLSRAPPSKEKRRLFWLMHIRAHIRSGFTNKANQLTRPPSSRLESLWHGPRTQPNAEGRHWTRKQTRLPGAGGWGQFNSSEKSGQSARPSHCSEASFRHVDPSAHWKPWQTAGVVVGGGGGGSVFDAAAHVLFGLFIVKGGVNIIQRRWTNKQATPTLNNDNVKVLFLAGHMRSFLTGFLLSCEWPEIKETYSKRVA